MSEYEHVSTSALKLKVDNDVKKKKKRKKEANRAVDQMQVSNVNKSSETGSEETFVKKPKPYERPLTKAEKSFLKMQEKRQTQRILEKAAKTHKQRVEEFNRHLDSLTEHYDIPKVSWTK